MTPEQITELVPKAHQRAIDLGYWDGLPSGVPEELEGLTQNQILRSGRQVGKSRAKMLRFEQAAAGRRFYLEDRLDDLSLSIAKTMAIYKAGGTPDHRWSYDFFRMMRKRSRMGKYEIYERTYGGTLDFWLTEVLFKAMDLMEFHGIAYTHRCILEENQLNLLRFILSHTSDVHYLMSIKLNNTVTVILRIVELAEIDLHPHITARLEYEKSGTQHREITS